MWITVDRPEAVPRSLRHKFSFTVSTSDGKIEDRHLDIGGLEVSRLTMPVISPPFRDGIWITGNGPSNTSIHRRAALLIRGQTWIPERFAIDWMKLGDDDKLWHDDSKINANYYGYGVEVLAVRIALSRPSRTAFRRMSHSRQRAPFPSRWIQSAAIM